MQRMMIRRPKEETSAAMRRLTSEEEATVMVNVLKNVISGNDSSSTSLRMLLPTQLSVPVFPIPVTGTDNCFTDQTTSVFSSFIVSPGESYILPSGRNFHYICVPTSERLKQKIISVIKSLPLQGQNVLVQYWGAKRTGKAFVLTTTCQPYGLYGINQELEIYRKACLEHKLYGYEDSEKAVAVGLPALVFLNSAHEQTKNLHNDYPKDQCPPCEDAIFSRIWGSFAVPVIVDGQCVGVLDFVMDTSLYSYDDLIAQVCRLLEHEGLQSSIRTDFPRRTCIKINSKKRMRRTKSLPHTSYVCLVPFFGLSSAVAAEMLGLSRGTFRNTCRRAGLPEWPGIPSKNTRRASSAPDQTRVNQALSDTSSIGTPIDDLISSCSDEEVISEWSKEKALIPVASASATCINQTVSETGHIADDFTFYWDGGVFKGSVELITTSETQVACDTSYIEAMPELEEMYYQGYDTQIPCDGDYTVAMPKPDEMNYQGYETTVMEDHNIQCLMDQLRIKRCNKSYNLTLMSNQVPLYKIVASIVASYQRSYLNKG